MPEQCKQMYYIQVFCCQAPVCHNMGADEHSLIASQLASFCPSAYISAPFFFKWGALYHLMEYLEGNPSFKITY